MDKELPKRKKNRLQERDYSACGAYFITVCTMEQRNYFWNPVGATSGRPQTLSNTKLSRLGKIAEEAIKRIPTVYPAVSVDDYVIMPNHIHILLRICADEYGRPMVAPTVSKVVQQLKGYVSKEAGIVLWQKSFFDHIIRNQKDYEAHLRYIYENPIRWCSDELYVEE